MHSLPKSWRLNRLLTVSKNSVDELDAHSYLAASQCLAGLYHLEYLALSFYPAQHLVCGEAQWEIERAGDGEDEQQPVQGGVHLLRAKHQFG